MQYPHRWRPAACLLVCAAGLAAADEAPAPAPAADQSIVTAFDASRVVADEVLDANRATAGLQVDKIQVNSQEVNGVVTGNVATGNTTGHNTVADGAFSSAAGFMTTIQNTGNNVLIQNSTIVTVSLEP